MDKSIYYEDQLREIMPLADHMGISEKQVIKIMDRMISKGKTLSEAGTIIGRAIMETERTGMDAVSEIKEIVGLKTT